MGPVRHGNAFYTLRGLSCRSKMCFNRRVLQYPLHRWRCTMLTQMRTTRYVIAARCVTTADIRCELIIHRNYITYLPLAEV